MKHLSALSALIASVTLAGCQSAGAASAPARMGPNPASSACVSQMERFITLREGDMLKTVLTSKAFASNSAISIAQKPLTDEKGTLVQGHERSMPRIYHLSESAAGCTMTRELDGSSVLLTSCACTPIRNAVVN